MSTDQVHSIDHLSTKGPGNRSFLFSLVFALSLTLRLWTSGRLEHASDQEAIYRMGQLFYLTGEVPAYGPKLVYTGESIPGGFQAVIAGLPLFLSNGALFGLQMWVGFLNWLAMGSLFIWLYRRVRPENRMLLAVFLAFSPWSILFSTIWNPSFLPVLSVPFFWILDSIARKGGSWRFIQAFTLGVLLILCFQIHLSTPLLGLAGLLFLPGIQKPLQFVFSGMTGVLAGGLFLIPWLIERARGAGHAPAGVVALHLGNLQDYFHTIFRYLSFPTAEIFRFLSDHGAGFQGMISNLMLQPWAFIPALSAYAFTFVIVGFAIRRLYGLRKHWKHPFSRVELLLPLLTPLLFIFSIKGASAHTFWILMPLSSFSAVMALDPVLGSKKSRNLAWLYLASALVLTLLAVK